MRYSTPRGRIRSSRRYDSFFLSLRYAQQHRSIKPYVDSMDRQVISAGKSRGSCRVPDVSDRSMSVEVSPDPGHGMDCRGHGSRDGVWMVVSGSGRAGSEGRNNQ